MVLEGESAFKENSEIPGSLKIEQSITPEKLGELSQNGHNKPKTPVFSKLNSPHDQLTNHLDLDYFAEEGQNNLEFYEEEKVAPQKPGASRAQTKHMSMDNFGKQGQPMGMIASRQSENKLSQMEANNFFDQLAEGTVGKSGNLKPEPKNPGILMKSNDSFARNPMQQMMKAKKRVEANPIPGNMFE